MQSYESAEFPRPLGLLLPAQAFVAVISTVPSNAILDRSGVAIVDRAANYIISR